MSANSGRIIARAREAGINFIDTADAYNEGRSEEIVGRAIRAERDAWVLATKMCNPMGPGPNQRGLSRRWMFQACDASLARLGTDWIDVMYLHREDHDTPLEETVIAMADLIRAGKVRYFGVSNYRSWRLAEICNICDRLGIDRPVVSQPYYNAMNRMPEVEHLPACGHYGLGVVPYSPLARGVLTGKYDPDVPPPQGTRAGRQDMRMMQTEWRRESLVIAQEIKRHAEVKGITPVPVRLRLGAQQPPGHGGDRRTAHARAARGLSAGARVPLRRRRRGAGRQPGRDRPSLDARLQRSGLSDRRAPDLDQAHPTIMIRRLEAADAEARLEELALLLRDAVLGGASIGFVLPLAPDELETYWRDVLEAVRGRGRILLAAFEGEALIGSVQLALEPRANGRHRAEVMKLMVLRSHRGRGAGRALMRALLEAARESGRSLLLLDVRTGDAAERLYRTFGFVPFGRVPAHARSPDGRLADTTFHFLQLQASGGPD